MQQLFSRNKLLTRVAGAFSPAALGNKLPGFLLSNPKIFKHENKAQTFTRRFAACSKLVVSLFAFLMAFMAFQHLSAQVISGRVGVFRDSIYVNGKWYNSFSGGGGGGVSGTGTSGNFPIWSGVFGSSSNSLGNSSLVENSNVLQINDSVVYLPDSNSSIKVTRINPYLLDSSGNKNYGSFSSLGGIFSSFYALLVDTVPSNHVLELNLKNINGLKYGIVNVYAGSLTGIDTVYLPPIDQAYSLNSEYGSYDFVVIGIRIFNRHPLASSIFVSVAKSDINKGVILGFFNAPSLLVGPSNNFTISISFYPDKFNNDWIVTF